MLLAVISVVLLMPVTSSQEIEYDDGFTKDPEMTERNEHWDRYDPDLVIVGQTSLQIGGGNDDNNEDRLYTWKYARPIDSNRYTDYSNRDFSESSIALPTTVIRESFESMCTSVDVHNPYGLAYVLYRVESPYDTKLDDRTFTFYCAALPKQFTLDECVWDDPQDDFEGRLDYQCTGVLGGIKTEYRGQNNIGSRKWSFYCCSLLNTPMETSATYDDRAVVTEITSDYENNARTTYPTKFGWPNWYNDAAYAVASNYPLTDARDDVSFWQRLCPKNGAFSSITQQSDNTFSFECAEFIDEITMANCFWTDDLNEFHGDFIGSCDEDGAIRGIQSYHSTTSDDRKFKIYCCDVTRETYTPNTNIQIEVKTHDEHGSGSISVVTFDLCWNNDLYQGIITPQGANNVVSTEEVIQHDSCGNERSLAVSIDSDDNVIFTKIGVIDNGVEYVMNAFDDGDSVVDTLEMDEDGVSIRDFMIQFPDDYLTACITSSGGSGCTGILDNVDALELYLITITLCESFQMATGTPSIGVVVRGTNGNLDKTILTGAGFFNQVPAGAGFIGDLVHLTIEYEGGPDLCIGKVILHDPYDLQDKEFGKEHFGDGIILSDRCSGDFRALTGIQYVPCYDTPFTITTYGTSLYTSIQIHSCSGSDAGISSANSALLSLTINGKSKNDKFVKSAALSLETVTDWDEEESRDYTLQLSGEFDRISLITLTNNHQTAALCVDSVLINGEDAFLSNYWVGYTNEHDSLPTIPAVLEWPICDIELTTTITAESPMPVDPEAIATSTCVNRNRLVSVDCEISQTFETHEEVSWEQETGQEVTTDITMEAGTSTTVSQESTLSNGYSLELGSEDAGIKAIRSFGTEFTQGSAREWSSTMSTSTGYTVLEVTTDGTVNGETIGIECSGSVSVPPSQEISYSLLIEQSSATLVTLTDIKMTKCSAYLYGEDSDYFDADDYVYIYGIEGELTVKDATNCYVSFSQAKQVNPEAIKCGEERALATREWGTYVPQCDEDTDKYMKCQCAFGDSWTLPTCGCVDVTTGNLLDTAQASVVSETDTYKWQDWCVVHCGDGSVHYEETETQNNAKAVPQNREPDEVVDKVSDSYRNSVFSENQLQINFGIMVALLGIMLIYGINSFISCYKQCAYRSTVHKYQSVGVFSTDTEVEKDIV